MRQTLSLLLLVGSLVFAQTYPGENNSLPQDVEDPPNSPPVWNNTPNPTAVEGIATDYDLLQDVADPESEALAFVNEAGCE